MENNEEETVEELRDQLEEMRDQLEQAAKFGQKLLEENKKTKKELLKEKELNEDKELQIGKYKLQLAEMSEILETIKKEYENENHDNQDQENLKEELETVKSRNQLLSHQLTEAEINNKTLFQELNMIKQESNNHDRLSDKLLLEIEELRKKLHQQNDVNNILKNKNEEMHRLQVELAKKIEHEKEENSILNSKLEDTLSEMQGLLKGGNTPEKREELLKKELYQLVLDHEALNEKYEEVKENKEKFEKLVSYLAQENEKLTQKINDVETENPPSIPEQKNLFQEHFEHHPKSGNGFSLFDQISENNDHNNTNNNTNNENNEVKTTPVTPTKEITAPVKSTPMKPVPNSPGDEEFFSIACTAIKIKLAIKFPHKSDEVFKIKAASLYEEAIKKGVPFHEWYTWIDETLNSKLMQINTPIIEHRNDVLVVTPNKKNNKTEAVKKKWFFQK